MRLLHCQLNDVRVHKALDLHFSPQLTVIGGSNESGKSTLVEALHRTLFLKASATGAPVEALQSRVQLGLPTVELTFEARGQRWQLRKRFSGSTGQVSLQNTSSQHPALQGPAAEEHLAGLLGVDGILSSRQAGKTLPGRWAHLWVMQGLAGDNPLATDRYDLNGLLEQLEQHGGAVIQQSRLDQLASQSLEAALAEQYTTRGVKRHSPLWEREQALEAAERQVTTAQQQLKEFEDASQELTQLRHDLHQLQTKLLPDLRNRQTAQIKQLETIRDLKAKEDLAVKALEPLQLKHRTAQEQIQRHKTLEQEIAERQQRFDQLTQQLKDNHPQQANLDSAVKSLENTRLHRADQIQALETSNLILQKRSQALTLSSEAERTQQQLKDLKQRRQRIRQFCRQRDALAEINATQIEALVALEREIREERIRCGAMATALTLLTSDQPVTLNGRPMTAGQELTVDELTELRIGDAVQLSIKPGGDTELSALKHSIETKERALRDQLSSMKLPDLEAATTTWRERQRLEQLIAESEQPSSEQIASLEQRQQALLERLNQLDTSADPDEGSDAMNDVESLQKQLDDQSKQLQSLRTSTRSLDTSLATSRAAQQRLQRERQDAAKEVELLGKDLEERRLSLSRLVAEHGTLEEQVLAQRDHQTVLGRAEEVLRRLQSELKTVDAATLLGEKDATTQQLDELQRRQDDLLDRRGAAKERCDRISATDPYDNLASAEAKRLHASGQLSQLRERLEAQSLLLELFRSAQNDLSQRYSQPLSQAVNAMLKPVLSGEANSRLHFEQTNGFHGLQLCQGAGVYDFTELSGGMREQLAAAVRLAMADVLRSGHDGCLPLIFDDAFTNSDPARIEGIKAMLQQAVDRGLQIILLSCDAEPYETIADVVHHLPSQRASAAP